MAQPRIMDSTDLHLEFVADEPMVTGCAVNAARISVGVQKNDASCQSKHVHNDADVVYAQIEKDVGNDYSVDVIEVHFPYRPCSRRPDLLDYFHL